MTEIYTLYSESGDEYKLQFTTDRSGIIADDILDQLNAQDYMTLARLCRLLPTGRKNGVE